MEVDKDAFVLSKLQLFAPICVTCTSEKLVDTAFEAFTQSADNI